jgi:hypothetical protein
VSTYRQRRGARIYTQAEVDALVKDAERAVDERTYRALWLLGPNTVCGRDAKAAIANFLVREWLQEKA